METRKHNYKLSPVDEKDIVASYLLDRSNDNIAIICSKYSIDRRTIYNLVNKTSEEEKQAIIDRSLIEYRNNFTKKTTIIIDKMLDRIVKQLDNTEEKIQLSQIVTSIGILYDKLRLENNQSTSNQSININIKIE